MRKTGAPKFLNLFLLLLFYAGTLGTTLAQEVSSIALGNLLQHESSVATMADFNNDGRQDFFISGITSITPFTLDAGVYLNNGDDTFSKITDTDTVQNGAVAVGDYNHDGFLDLALMGTNADGDPVTVIYKNSGGTSFVAQSLGITALDGGFITWLDVDLDGDLDLLQSGRNLANSPKLNLWRNDSGAFTLQSTNLLPLTSSHVAVADMDGDYWPDLVLLGNQVGTGAVTDVFLNAHDYTFTKQNAGFTAVSTGQLAIADYNEDGFPDVAFAGVDGSVSQVAKLYRNEGDGSYTEIAAGLTPVGNASALFADMDNDGLRDLILAGAKAGGAYQSTIYRNTASTYAYVAVEDTLQDMAYGYLAAGDVDGDGDQDLLQTGLGSASRYSALLRNVVSTSNAAPASPTGLSYSTSGDSVLLCWNAPTDDRTASASLTYAVYVGTSAGAQDVLVANANLSNGDRRLPNSGTYTTSLRLRELAEGQYFWSVQAIDASGRGSSFATEATFSICSPLALGADTAACYGDTLAFAMEVVGASVDWYTTLGGLQSSGAFDYSHIVSQTDTLVVAVTQPWGCTVYDSLIITNNPLPNFSVGNDTAVCEGDLLELTVNPTGWVDTDWYSLKTGVVAANTESYAFQVTTVDTLFARVADALGCVGYDSVVVSPIALPVPDLGLDTAGCLGDTLTLGVSPTGWADVSWVAFGNGAEVSIAETFDWAIAQTDTLAITVTDTDGCIGRDTLIITARNLPSVSVGSDTSGCIGDSVLIQLSPSGWANTWWYYESEDSLLTTGVNEWLHPVYTDDTLLVKVEDAFGCQAMANVTIEAYALPNFSLGNDTAICVGDSLTISTTPAGWSTVSWNSAQQGLLATTTFFHTQAYAAADTLWATVKDGNGCEFTDTVVVNVNALPSFSLGNDTARCVGDTIPLAVTPGGWASVTWLAVSDLSIVGTTDALDWVVVQSDTLTVTVTDAYACASQDQIVVSAQANPVFSAGGTVNGCDQDTLQLTVSPDSWSQVNWYSATEGTLVQADQSVFEILVTSDSAFVAEVLDDYGCASQDTVRVVRVAPTPFSAPSDTTICEGEALTLLVSTDWAVVNWFEASGDTLQANAFFTTFSPSASAAITVQVQDDNGCTSVDTTQITLLPAPVFSAITSSNPCLGDTLVATTNPGGWTQVAWADGDTTLVTDTLRWLISGDASWVAKVKDGNGCEATDTISIVANALPTPQLGADTTYCMGEELIFTLADGSTASWYVGDTLFTANADSLAWTASADALWRVEVTDSLGCVGSDAQQITVNALPSFDLGADTTLCEGASLLLNVGFGWSRVDWYLEGDSTPLDTNSYFYQYPVQTSANLVAEVSNVNGCTARDTIGVQMQSVAAIDLGADTSLCFGESLALSVEGTWSTVVWTPSLTAESIGASFSMVVTRRETIEVLATDANGCEASDEIVVSPLSSPAISLADTLSYCVGQTATLDLGNSGSTVTWFVGTDTLIQSAFSFVVDSSFALAVQVENSNGCTAVDSTVIMPLAKPTVSVEDLILCEGTPYTLSLEGEWQRVRWYALGSGELVSNTSTYADTANQEQSFRVVGTSLLGCQNADTVSVVPTQAPAANAGLDQSICAGESVVLGPETITSGWDYHWTPAVGLSADTVANPVATPSTTTTYTLQVTTPYGCSNREEVEVIVSTPLVIDAGADTAICLGSSIQLGGAPTAEGGNGSYTYSWTPTGPIGNGNDANPVVAPQEDTQYTLVVQSGECPADTATIMVRVQALPVVAIFGDTAVEFGQEALMEASGGARYQWSPAGLLNSTSGEVVSTVPLQATATFQVRALDDLGCAGTAQHTVLVTNQAFLPELFSPNGDGNNDRFTLLGQGIGSIDFRIYDRRGVEVFRTTDVNQALSEGWDGTMAGRPAPLGDYFWSVSGTFLDGSALTIQGENTGRIRLLR